jgi:hypothetical protein
VIRRVENRLGDITVTEVGDASAAGTFSGAGAVKVV